MADVVHPEDIQFKTTVQDVEDANSTLYYPESEDDPWVYRFGPDGNFAMRHRDDQRWIDVRPDSTTHADIMEQLQSGALYSRGKSETQASSFDPKSHRDAAIKKAMAPQEAAPTEDNDDISKVMDQLPAFEAGKKREAETARAKQRGSGASYEGM